MLSKTIREPIYRLLGPVGKAIAATGITPNGLTILGFLIVLGGCYLVAGGRHLEAAFVISVGGLFDSFDGMVAKITGKASKRGAFLDSTLDRLADSFLFGAAAWFYMGLALPGLSPSRVAVGESGIDLISTYGAAISVGCLILALMISYVRSKAESLGYDGSAGLAERAERVIVYIAGLFFGYFGEALLILLVVSAATLVHRFVSVWNQSKPQS